MLPDLRHIPRKFARLCLKVEKICRKKFNIPQGAGFLLAVSGGADSLALALIFAILANRMNSRLMAVHVHHHLRPEADEDARHTEYVCSSLGLPFELTHLDAKALAEEKCCGIEEAGRIGRYALLDACREKHSLDYIVTAHHAGDLAEDVLMRLNRGAGWPALGGMTAKDEKRHLLRPLLYENPEALRDFLTSLGISWREDASNKSPLYKRNRIRKTVMPWLLEENPNFYSAIKNLHELAGIDDDFWQNELSCALAAHPWSFCEAPDHCGLKLPGELLASLHPAARLRLYVRALRHIGQKCNNSIHARAATLLDLDSAWRSRSGGLLFQLPGDISARLERGEIIFLANK